MRLRRSDLARPGLTRRRCGRGFTYLDADGRKVTDLATLERVHGLVIPPAWQDVWISPWPHGHIQAVGVDAAGRRQYLYHPHWRVRRDADKHQRARELGLALPSVREALAADLARRGLPRERVLAAALRLIDLGLFRVGSEGYAKENGSYGIATALRAHVSSVRGGVSFCMPAKHGVEFCQDVTDPAVCQVLRALLRRDDPSDRLLACRVPGEPGWQELRSDHINAYLRELVGELPFTAKDFRTWHGTVLMAMALSDDPPPRAMTARRRVVAQAYRDVAGTLCNTPAVARSSYVDPRVVDRWYDGERISWTETPGGRHELVPLSASTATCALLA
jgi:DNA topoisomerase IB